MYLRSNILVLLSLVLALQAQHEDDFNVRALKDEFNISAYWHPRMGWEEFLSVRNRLKREGLIKYVDKIEQQKMARSAGIEVPKTYLASRKPVPFTGLLSNLSSYVVKMTHLSLGQGLMIVKDGTNLVTGKPITPEEIQATVEKNFAKKPRGVESWALHQVQPGFMVQEYIPRRTEVKIQTIWGKAVIGEYRGGEASRFTRVKARYNREGKTPDGSGNAPSWWPDAVKAAERLAQGTDALRVDFLIRKNGELLLNELEIWPESDWSAMKTAIERRLNAGYKMLRNLSTTHFE